ncbi:hypothetical protein [Teredinibacter sp. KSP-S5-2]|uniref:hypothetical protein n=1 Tax=Teredinibacter sp. KSP-S5-2 TaxID=3034506 RepID=UPI0029352FCE|nr:hypothetical protein [Teredinibacter sp. KSP-S5-2]WNO10469.1 hypothetical protein P5V12_04720 [Teredinibacter sp. KSP-S5-2]
MRIRAIRTLLASALLSTSVILASCGSGDNGGTPTPTKDTTPNAYSFSASTNVGVGETVESPEVTISGIDSSSRVTITNGEFSINGGAYGTTGSISNGQTLQLRLTASSEFSMETTTTVTVGGVSASYSVTTIAQDITPEAFSFNPVTGASVSSVVTSNAASITGINDAAPVTISGGQFSIDSGDYGTTGNISNGQSIVIRITAASTPGTDASATLSIGGVEASFTVTTVADTTPPEAQVAFPTPTTLTDGLTVTLRGKATDDFGPVASITVTVTADSGATQVDSVIIAAGANDNYMTTWSIPVDLAVNKLNTIQVAATDGAGNTQTVPTVLTILQTDQETNFPAGNEVYIGEMSDRGIDMDMINNRILVPGYSKKNILAVDIDTGVRSEFIAEHADLSEPLRTAYVDESNNRLFFGETNQLNVADLDTGVFSLVTDNTNGDSDINMVEVHGLDLHSSSGLLYAADQVLYSINPATGARTLVSGSDRPVGGANPLDWIVDVVLDEGNNRALVSDVRGNKLFWVDLTSGERTLFVESPIVNAPFHMDNDEDDNRVVFVNTGTDQVMQVDLTSAAVSIVSDGSTPDMGANQYLKPRSLTVDSENDVLYLLATRQFETTTWLYVIDINTGERVILSRSVSPVM